MPYRLETPLAGLPRTVESRDKAGNPVFTIRPRELTPARAKTADDARGGIALAAVIGWVYGLYLGWQGPWEPLAVSAGLMFAIYLVLTHLIRACLHATTTIEMSTGAISVRRWYGWKHYDRNVEHRFALLAHDRAQAERQDLDYDIRSAAGNGRAIRKTAYYGESFHVVLAYAGHRVDLLSVYGQKPAAAIIARLQFCDRRLNEAVKMGGGINSSPQDEWNEGPGGLSDV